MGGELNMVDMLYILYMLNMLNMLNMPRAVPWGIYCAPLALILMVII